MFWRFRVSTEDEVLIGQVYRTLRFSSIMEVQLRRLGPNSKIKILKVPKDCRTKIWLAGRGTTCQIYTKSKYASRQHFSITYREQKYFISDLQSANGTYLNDEKLMEEKMLSFGNLISVGVPSEMSHSPDCIVYIFESYSGHFSAEKVPGHSKNDKISEMKNSSEAEPPSVLLEVGPESNTAVKEVTREFLDADESSVDLKKADLDDSSSSDVVLIEAFTERKKHSMSLESESKPSKIRKLGESGAVPVIKCEEVSQTKAGFLEQGLDPRAESLEDEGKAKEISSENEDIFAYEALTQVDEQVKTEPELLNYSLTEEVIEISDSEDDWSPRVGTEERRPSEEFEDDDIIVLETIIKSKEPMKTDLPPVYCELGDELTEVDRKWLGRLLKIKEEKEFIRGDEEEVQEKMEGVIEAIVPAVDELEKEKWEDPIKDSSSEPLKAGGDPALTLGEPDIIPCSVKLIRHIENTSTADIEDKIPASAPDLLPRVEIPKKIVKRVVPKKSVTFDLVPQIKYFEVPSRSRLTASEKGRMQFTRVIFNICNWNTHWLEECRKVAPGKYPPICEDRLRKIPKKFPSHSDYMVAFIPPMLLHLWNKIKEKWVNSGNYGFRQTVSFDSSEDYHAEKLTVYKCTGLVQSVDAHKALIREGHLVLLRLHQIQNPQFITPASEKYSKKLGYLVFGFVESKTYERFHNQSLHHSLAERCASVVGDLHIVRLTILVKKRPNFQIDRKKLIQLMVVHQISQEVRMFRGICFLPDSPLCTAILKPSSSEFPLVELPAKENLIFKGPIDEVQSEIIKKLSLACSSSSSLLYSIHGAAGTGKGQVIIGLILQFLFGDEWKNQKPKIIYCTQWSIPLDETVLKLKNYRQTFEKLFSLVRVGPVREVKPEVRDLCVSSLASSLRNSDKKDCGGKKFDAEVEVIKEADVICTTCISAGTASVCSAFEKLTLREKDRKVICIIDEAMSCKETDSAIPLLLGVTHLILVGDIYQLEPNFSGEKTHSLGLDVSLFWRIYKNFINVPKDLWPIHILKTQYRMNYDLSKFTNQLIYGTPLQKPALSVPNRIGNLKTHLLLVDRTPENILNEEKENREARIVSYLVKAVTKLTKISAKNIFLRFAVITCDVKQTESLQALLPKREFPEVEINQIQAFQGREFEVVIFMYDGRNILTSWLATALTRARCSLLIFASEKSINENFFLQKMAKSAEKNSFLRFVHPDMTMNELEELISAS